MMTMPMMKMMVHLEDGRFPHPERRYLPSLAAIIFSADKQFLANPHIAKVAV